MTKRIILILFLCGVCSVLNALEITRYVSIGGTGDGLSPENPTADLGAMLSLSEKVDQLTLYVSPGFYSLNFPDYGEGVGFKNVILNGEWKKEDPIEKVRIHYPGVGFSNSYIVNVSFSGAGTINGGVMLDCDADKAIYAGFDNGNVTLKNCKTKSFGAAYYGYGSKVSLTMENCIAKDGDYGLQTKNTTYIDCYNCIFNNQSEGGIDIDNCLSCQFIDCEIGFSSGDGAVRVTAFDNNASASFKRCSFIANRVTYNHQNNIYVYPNATFVDCLFADNTEKDIDHRGFIHLVKPNFLFLNCSFINNNGGIEMEQYYPDQNQIINCLFWNNGKTVAYAGGRDVPMLACAMDHGTGIPELDREKGLIILTDANKGFEYNGIDFKLEPNSPLINAGVQRFSYDKDLNGHPRSTFGAADIGCTELITCPGLWIPDDTKQSVVINNNEYQMYKAPIGETTYYCLIPEYIVKNGDIDFSSYFRDFLYLDTMPLNPGVHDGKYIEVHTKEYRGKYYVNVYQGLSSGGFKLLATGNYDSLDKRSKVKIANGKVEFVKPVAKTTPQTQKKTPAPARKSTSRKPTTSPKKTYKK